MKSLRVSLKLFLVLSILTGIIYPIIVTFYAQLFVQRKAMGSLVVLDGVLVGSELIGQKFTADKYFWSRPSAVDYNATSSGGSNLGFSSQVLFEQFKSRKAALLNSSPTVEKGADIPQDLLFASGSGLDPHISPAAALFQVERIASVRKINQDLVRNLVNKLTDERQFGILGQPRVNVLLLNVALDKEFK